MNLSFEIVRRYSEWNAAVKIIGGNFVSNWFRKGSEAEDKMIAEANGVILDNLSNADTVGQIEKVTEQNLRDQITVEQALELHQERNLRGFSRRN